MMEGDMEIKDCDYDVGEVNESVWLEELFGE